MERRKIENFDYIDDTNRLLRSGGVLLVTEGNDRKPNAMTIGWGLVGTMWRRPMFNVAVRLSRYTYKLLEESNKFTVCLPAKGMEEVLDVCGTKSGRDIDKFKALKLNVKRGFNLDTPYIVECPVHYECDIVYKTELKRGQLIGELEKDVYPSGDYHVLYFGQIKGVYALDNTKEIIPSE